MGYVTRFMHKKAEETEKGRHIERYLYVQLSDFSGNIRRYRIRIIYASIYFTPFFFYKPQEKPLTLFVESGIPKKSVFAILYTWAKWILGGTDIKIYEHSPKDEKEKIEDNEKEENTKT